MRNRRVTNVSLVSGVEQNDRFLLFGIMDPVSELGARCNCASGIVWKTKINQIDFLLRRRRHETVSPRAREINDSLKAAVLSRRTGVTRHYVGIHIDRVNWIGNRNP